jgi:hypothetical protein
MSCVPAHMGRRRLFDNVKREESVFGGPRRLSRAAIGVRYCIATWPRPERLFERGAACAPAAFPLHMQRDRPRPFAMTLSAEPTFPDRALPSFPDFLN